MHEIFDLRPFFISKRLDRQRPIYKKASVYSHFEREDVDFSWEATEDEADLRTAGQGLVRFTSMSSVLSGPGKATRAVWIQSLSVAHGVTDSRYPS